MKVAYFTSQYPAVSHTFIRREIRAMEQLGLVIYRFALRSGENIVDYDDEEERSKTRYILDAGIVGFVHSVVSVLLRHPLSLIGVVFEAVRMGWSSERGILRHLFYVLEASVLSAWCRRDSIQHIHAHFGTNPAAIAMFAHTLSGISFSFTAHGSEEFEKAPLLSLQLKLSKAMFAVCVSSFGRAQLMRWSTPALWPKISIVHCGLDPLFLASTVTPPPEHPRFVCVGRLDEHKAQLVLVEAVHLLVNEGIHCEVILAGDGEMRPDVQEAINRFGLQDSMKITGWVSGARVRSEICSARALILPSFSENLPVVIMEALALGRPVISTYVAGIPELVLPGINGWLVPAGDEVCLADAIREALSLPGERLLAMGAAGRLRVLDRHDSLKEAAKLKRLFETCELP